MEYDYRRAMTDDIKNWINENTIPDDVYSISEFLEEELWENSDITGNGPYYYGSEKECGEYLAQNFDLAAEAADEFCVEWRTIAEKARDGEVARYLDTTIRCYLLNECIYAAMEELGLND